MLKKFMHSKVGILGAVLLCVVVLMAVLADWIYPDDPLDMVGTPLQWPFQSSALWLGTDGSGRDIAAQIFHGAKVSLMIGVIATALSVVLGTLVGGLTGYYQGWVDDMGMRIVDAFQTVPSFLLLLLCVVVFGSNIQNTVISIAVVSWTAPARLVRAEFLSLRKRDFIAAGRMIGLSDRTIIFREILPNALPPIIVYGSVLMASAILLESALAFLNLSDPNIASWGNLIGQGKNVLRTEWYVSAIPGVAILITVLGVSLLGQGLNDMLNPRLRGRT